MARRSKARDPIPEHFASIEAAAAFWETHSLADYEDVTTAVEFTVNLQRRRHVEAMPPAVVEQPMADRSTPHK